MFFYFCSIVKCILRLLHFKRIISLLACIFFGYMVRAERQHVITPRMAGHIVYSFKDVNGISAGDHAEQRLVFSQQKPDNKDISFRKRFRPGSLFVFSLLQQQEQVRPFVIPPRTCGIPRNNRHTLPAYYAFLFRLTPF